MEKEVQIRRLQKNLKSIRKIIGWSTEDLGGRIGVTKQTISNIETEKTKMTLTQYIAIRAILDLECQENENMKEILPNILENVIDNENIDETDEEKIREGLSQTAAVAVSGVTGAALVSASTGLFTSLGLTSALIAPVASAMMGPIVGGAAIGILTSKWLMNLSKNKNKKEK